MGNRDSQLPICAKAGGCAKLERRLGAGFGSADAGAMCVVRAVGSDENPSWVPDGFVAPSWLD